MSQTLESADRTFDNSAFCWAKDFPPGRNQFVSFERRFDLDSDLSAHLHLFADTRYRLFVNGEFVAYGPGRFVTSHPEYDTFDLKGRLRSGENLLRVEVNYYGCSSFQTMPDGLPGFIAAGGAGNGSVDFGTPGNWQATIHRAWDPEAPYFSFAQNPAEICDTRILEKELSEPASHPVVSLPPDKVPWAKPAPRSAPYPDYAIVHPARIMAAGPVADSLRWGVQLHRHAKDAKAKEFVSFITWIHSPKKQVVPLDIFWTEAELNGKHLTITYPGRLGNHGECTVELLEGWNFLAGNYEVLLEQWSFLLGLPRESGATLHALPDLACEDMLLLSGPRPQREMPAYPDSRKVFSPPPTWKAARSDLGVITPARLTGWDTPVKSEVVRDKPIKDLQHLHTHTARTAMWSFDYKDEFYGQPVVEVEAPAGSILDVAYDDWSRADGCVNLYYSNPFTETVDRFKLKGGRQRIEVLNPRGGIYMELVLRAPAGSEEVPLAVHEVAIRRRTVYNKCEGAFKSGDPLLDWAWATGVHTLHASTDEAYADCPWRERGSYIGDSLVNLHINRLFTSDLRTARRTFHNFGLAQFPGGLLSGCAPAWLRGQSEDFTLYWILGVHDIWAHTGDLAFAAQQWPVLQSVLASKTWKRSSNGLWDTDGMFVDWGMKADDGRGEGNATLNILRIACLRDAAELARALGHTYAAVTYDAEAVQTSDALMAHLWNETDGMFNPSIGHWSPAVHANILALRFNLGHADRILAHLEPLLADNFKIGEMEAPTRSYAELFFFFFLLPALAAHGRADLAESIVRQHYGFIRALGHPTLPETFHRADHGSGSCCHSWSGAAAVYATEYVLGLRLETPGNPDVYRLAPVDSGRSHAEGTLPHRLGSIHAKWTRDQGRFSAHVIAPKGVSIVGGPDVDLTTS